GEAEQIAAMRGSADDWMQLGNLAMLAGNPNRAVKAFQRAAEIVPEAWEPHYNLGALFDAAGLSVEAGKEYSLALQYGDDSYAPRNGLGLWLLRHDRVEEAIAQLTRALELAPGLPAAKYNLALAYAKGHQAARAKDLLDSLMRDAGDGSLTLDAAR